MSLKAAYQAVRGGVRGGLGGLGSKLRTNAGYVWGSTLGDPRTRRKAMGWATGKGGFLGTQGPPRPGFLPIHRAGRAGRRAGVGGARLGLTASSADFLNPWGFGWGD